MNSVRQCLGQPGVATTLNCMLQGERGKPGLPGEKGEAGDPVSAWLMGWGEPGSAEASRTAIC